MTAPSTTFRVSRLTQADVSLLADIADGYSSQLHYDLLDDLRKRLRAVVESTASELGEARSQSQSASVSATPPNPAPTFRVSCMVEVEGGIARDQNEARELVTDLLRIDNGIRSVEVDGVTELQALQKAVDEYLSAPNLRGENYRALMALVALSKQWNGGTDVFQAARIRATR